jgi:hypothetical protein
MRIDLSDLPRLTGFAEALERLFWCLMVLGFFTAILGSAGTGLFVLLLGAAAFVLRAGLEDFVRSRSGEPVVPQITVGRTMPVPRKAAASKKKPAPKRTAAPRVKVPEPDAEPEFTVYRTRRHLRRTKSAV